MLALSSELQVLDGYLRMLFATMRLLKCYLAPEWVSPDRAQVPSVIGRDRYLVADEVQTMVRVKLIELVFYQ